MELVVPPDRRCRLIAELDKVHHVSTIALVARRFGLDEDRIAALADDMEPENGLIWVLTLHDEDSIMAFTPEGIEYLEALIADEAQWRLLCGLLRRDTLG
ncbi:hypothetical protein KY084_14360 [Stakelama sp. CBK3Z-3]|uniref:MarR family transcriptional regulator n=1 Tax=Stakelama flava TaxID=2860338 RepID=A0ABS6XPA0_9SPHN|nr:hypothetical protein [Stakelama flava]MBW4332049.1 hypothetical protein [Stakelama flava]